MDTTTKIKRAGQIGSWYFLLLGCVNLILALIYSRTNWFDAVVLGLSVLPMLIQAKRFHMVFGIIGCFFAIAMGVICFLEQMTFEAEPAMEFFYMIYLFVLSFLAASALLTYAGLASKNDDRFDLI